MQILHTPDNGQSEMHTNPMKGSQFPVERAEQKAAIQWLGRPSWLAQTSKGWLRSKCSKLNSARWKRWLPLGLKWTQCRSNSFGSFGSSGVFESQAEVSFWPSR